jgi:hypothetical protein
VIQGADFPGSGARPQGVSISEAKGCQVGKCELDCKGDCELTFVPGISTSTVSLTRKFGSVSNCSKFGIDLDKVKKKQMSVSDFVGGVQSSQYLRPLTAGYCEEIRFPDDVVQKIVTLDDLNNNVDKLISVRIRENSASGFSADTKAFIKPSIPLKMKFNGNDISVNTITMYHPSPLRVQDQQADAVISLNDPSAGDDSSYIILIPITTGNPETPSAKFFGKIANQLSSVELPILATGQYAKTDIQTGKDWGLSDLFPIGAVEGGQAKVDAGFFVWEGMPAFERYLDFWRSNANVTQYAWRRKDNGGKPIKYIMLEKPLPVSPNDLAALIRSLPVTDWTDAIHEVFSPENGVLYKQGPPGANCGTPMREHMDNEWTNKLYGETSALGSAISDEVGCDPFSAVNVPDKGFSTKKILTLVFNVLVLVAAAIGAYLALAAVARMYDVEYTDFTKGIGKVVAVYAKKMGAKIGKLRDIATMARGGPAGLAGLAAPGGLAALGAPGAPAAPGGLAALTAPGGLAALTAPGGLAALTAPGGLAALGGPGAPAALADEVPEAPEAPAALADTRAQANSRGISPGIASRMKNFSSSAAVTPTGQASRGLFNMARTMGRARPDRDHGGLTRRARR